MDAMNRRGVTLTELITVLVTGSILIVAVAVQFFMMIRVKTDMENRIYVMREARIIMDHMSSRLRFARPGSVNFRSDQLDLRAKVEGGCLATIPDDTIFTYKRDASNAFIAIRNDQSETGQIIGNGVTFFDIDNTSGRLWDPDPTKRLLTLRFTVTKDNVSIPAETTIKVMGAD
jgi:hypothetical protein